VPSFWQLFYDQRVHCVKLIMFLNTVSTFTCTHSIPLPPIAYMQHFPLFILTQLLYLWAVWLMLVWMCQSSARTQYFFCFCPTDTFIRDKPPVSSHQEERSNGEIPLVPKGQAVSSPLSNSTPLKANTVTVKHVHVMSTSLHSMCLLCVQMSPFTHTMWN